MGRTCYFVMGPESSGTRMMGKAFVQLGIYGDSDHKQRLDDLDFVDRPDRIAFRRSFPHGPEWPDVAGLVATMRAAGYRVVPVVTLRQREYCAESQVRIGHSKNMAAARAKIDRAVEHIWTGLARAGLVPVVVAYEPFVRSPEVRRVFFQSLGLDVPTMEWRDGNRKYR
jgi:hypothetical protein